MTTDGTSNMGGRKVGQRMNSNSHHSECRCSGGSVKTPRESEGAVVTESRWPAHDVEGGGRLMKHDHVRIQENGGLSFQTVTAEVKC